MSRIGYSQSELEDIQTRWKLRFPPDLADLLRERRPLLDCTGAFDWLTSDPAIIQERLDWPFEGFWFACQRNHVWWPEWGNKSPILAEQYERLREIFTAAPKLIPLIGHRYIPEDPFERDNPVLSVYGTDIICYGANLLDWIERELSGWHVKPLPQIKEITFWSEALRKNNAIP